jgi:hypothetical protein
LFVFLHHHILDWIAYAVNPGTLSVGRQETGMRRIERVYIGGKLTVPHGTELFDLFDPSKEEIIGQVRFNTSAAWNQYVTQTFQLRLSASKRVVMARRTQDVALAVYHLPRHCNLLGCGSDHECRQ